MTNWKGIISNDTTVLTNSDVKLPKSSGIFCPKLCLFVMRAPFFKMQQILVPSLIILFNINHYILPNLKVLISNKAILISSSGPKNPNKAILVPNLFLYLIRNFAF